MQPSILRFNNFELHIPSGGLYIIDPDSNTKRKNRVVLTSSEGAALVILATSGGRPVPIEEFARRLPAKRDKRTRSASTIQRLISKVRERLETAGSAVFSKDLIRKVGEAYVFRESIENTSEFNGFTRRAPEQIWKHFWHNKTYIVFTNEPMWLKPTQPQNLSLKPQKGRVRIDSYSGHGEVFSAFEIGRLFSSHASEAKLIRATEGARDLLREANVIWLGSPLASEVLGDILKMDIWIRPWECSFEHSEANPPGNTVIKCNGRKHTYTTKAWGASKKEYGWIGLSKTRYHTYFLLLAGTDTSATRACTELACSIDTPNEECMREILEKRADSDGTFEVLIELTKGAQAAALGPIVWSRQALQTGDAEN